MEDATPEHSSDSSRANRLAQRRGGGQRRRILIGVIVVAIIAAGAGATYALVGKPDTSSASTAPTASTTRTTKRIVTTSTHPTTTTTTIPPIKNPKDVQMPAPNGTIGYGSSGPIVQMYQQRMKDLHFDPGPIDGVFSQNTQYAVIAVQKYFNQPRTGHINTALQLVLSHFTYQPAMPLSEPNRVEIDLDKQVLTVYRDWQPILLTTTSTGSGAHFCGGTDGCQYAITPAGHYHFNYLKKGWDKGKLGKMWNPYYFNGGIAVHGLDSVPAYSASHGCARIPMHIADYFYTLVDKGESVFVVGTPKQAGNGYVGPAPKAKPAATTTVPKTTAPPAATTPTTAKKSTTPTTKKSTTPTTKK